MRKSRPQNPDNCMQPPLKLSVDWWSVITALAAAVLIKFGVLPHIPW